MTSAALIARYERTGLEPPIVLGAGWKAWVIGVLAGPGLTLTSGLVGVYAPLPANLIGLFGLLFFGLCTLLLGVALWRSIRGTGLVRLSPEGLYLATIGMTLPWRDLGPAYPRVTHHQGGRTVDVCFPLRNLEDHRARADALGRVQFWIAAKVSGAPPEGVATMVSQVLMASQGVRQETPDGHDDPFSEARAMREADASAALFTVPGAFLSPDDAAALAAILTAEAERAHAADGAP